jgi:putative SOS response-associated peptidase YedK
VRTLYLQADLGGNRQTVSVDARPPPRNTQPRYNICPTTTIDTLLSTEGKRTLVPMRWGLIPFWWNKPLKETRLATFNARAETVATKPMFRDAFKSERA